MDNTLIILDGGSVASQIRYSFGNLSFNDIPTGITFGFLNKILSLYKQFDSNKFVFAWDSRSSKRKQLYLEYKLNRSKHYTQEELEDRDNYYKQIGILRKEVLPSLGFVNSFVQKGHEADDIIASVVNNDTDITKVIVSEDSDLYQLLRSNVSILQKKGIITKNSFISKYKIKPTQWWQVKAIGGCTSDNVKGMVGTGEKIAIKYINNELKPNSDRSKKIDEFCDSSEYAIYKRLVKLPFENTDTFTISKDKLSWEMFLKTCGHYDFESFLYGDQYKYWKRFFGESRPNDIYYPKITRRL